MERPVLSVASSRRSEKLFADAERVFPGGVSSPVRAFRAVGGTPRFIARGRGAILTDVDDNDYVDCVLSWGALALGHAHPAVVEAIAMQAERGTSFGAPTELETQLAELITQAMPAVEMLRFVSSGTEAVMSALRLARAATGRTVIVKFDGCYHGHADAMLVSAGSGVATLGLPDSPGVTAAAVADTVSVPFNDLPAVEELFNARGGQIAAVIVEPVAGNMGLVLPADGFLSGLRRLTRKYGALLIFDEVMTGARVARGGAQELCGIEPDLSTLGKVIGGGLPVAAYGGRADLMQEIAPAGRVYQAGTLSGNPLAMAAGIATMRELAKPGAYEQLAGAARALADGIAAIAQRRGVAIQSAAVGGMWGFFFAEQPVTDYASAKRSDTALFGRFFHACLEAGVYLAPSQFESGFVSLAHDANLIQRTLAAFENAFDVAYAEGGNNSGP
jgi:glutamate-1-semialdehyde 2,1-aminomutase